ncbi:tripartite tricarboxylate transporter TctB family protein [Leptothrix sp. BB-4]
MKEKVAQTGVGAGVVVIALAYGAGALGMPSEAGYGGVGPNFLPLVVSGLLLVCGLLLVVHARVGGFREFDGPEGDERGHWIGFAWVSAGILLNAALITRIGFVLACALCFLLAARGFQVARGDRLDGLRSWLRDGLTGIAIAAPVYWLFGKLLAIQLPGLGLGGWL